MERTLGERLRRRREELGLSQTGVAKGISSPSYVSLIEAGKRVPEREMVEALAGRLGTTPEWLETGLDPAQIHEEQLQLRYADLSLANGETAEALNRYRMLVRAGGRQRYAALWGAARSHEALGDLSNALRCIETLLDDQRAGRAAVPGLLVLLTAQCRLYREVGDLHHSVTVGEHALEEVRALGLLETEDAIRLASTLVASYWERGDWTRASLLAGEVMGQAEEHGSRRSRGSAYWNASLAASTRGDVVLALELAERALAMFAEENDERSLARLRTDFAWILLAARPPQVDRAAALLERAHAGLVGLGVSVDLAYCETELARCRLMRGEPEAALQVADSSLARLQGRRILEAARLHLLRAGGLAMLDDPPAAREACEAARDILLTLPASRHIAAVWREHAEMLMSLGDARAAVESLRHLADAVGSPQPPWTDKLASRIITLSG
jgi:transcriptional regulator with XRE-family HTH domain